jgi:hypothetical protein
MNRRTISILLILGLLLTACNHVQENEAIPTSAAIVSKQPFPLSVNLVFNPIQLEQLTEGKPDKNWELLKEIPFGEVRQQKIVLYIYQEPKKPDDPSAYKHAIIRFQNKNYPIPNLISTDLSETPMAEHSTMFLLQHTFSYHDNQLVLLGGIELEANGPGRVAYIMYDIVKNIWVTFEDWGKPSFVDLDSDGVDEFVIQFEGLHLNFPDVTVYTWNRGIIEVSNSIKTAVLGSKMSNYAILGNDKKISIGDNSIDEPGAQYIYEKGKLLKQ